MSEREGYEHGVPCWVEAWQRDPHAGISFYSELLGWEARLAAPEGDRRGYWRCSLHGRDVAAIGTHPDAGVAWNTVIWVEDADAAAAKAVELGGSVVAGPFDGHDGSRLAVLSDPDGASFSVLRPGEHRGAGIVNEPGAWSMSQLHPGDPERAKAFYGELFGWTTETFEMGEESITMFKLPGYVGGEPSQPVARDVIAVMVPRQDGRPPAWGVDFWVSDARGAAAKARELGGGVAVEPFEAPPFLTAVLTDRDGAVFSVSELRAG